MKYYDNNKKALNDLISDLENDNGILLIAKEDVESELEYADKCHNLEEELGCPLEVLVKLWKQHNYYALKPRGRTLVRQMDFPIISYILKGNKNQKMPYKDNSFILGGTCYDYDCFDKKSKEFDGWDVNLADYQKTWYLKEDKSE